MFVYKPVFYLTECFTHGIHLKVDSCEIHIDNIQVCMSEYRNQLFCLQNVCRRICDVLLTEVKFTLKLRNSMC